jgi:hypothetical protein
MQVATKSFGLDGSAASSWQYAAIFASTFGSVPV